MQKSFRYKIWFYLIILHFISFLDQIAKKTPTEMNIDDDLNTKSEWEMNNKENGKKVKKVKKNHSRCWHSKHCTEVGRNLPYSVFAFSVHWTSCQVKNLSSKNFLMNSRGSIQKFLNSTIWWSTKIPVESILGPSINSTSSHQVKLCFFRSD